MAMTADAARLALPYISDESTAFDIFATVSELGAGTERAAARELLIRALEWRDSVPPSLQGLLAALVREHGLFPYLESTDELSLADSIAYEVHRPLNFPDARIVFHAEQAEVYRRLLNGDNVVLSAPTSFGKSLVIDAVLAARDFRDVVVIVPTIALIDETRRRLARLSYKYKVITHPSQPLAERNLFVVTQERLPPPERLRNLDFFVIDEFYKLDSDGEDNRAAQLNIAFRQLLSSRAQFYLLGPNISALAAGVQEVLRATFFHTDFKTVATDVEQLSVPTPELQSHLTRLIAELDGQTLVYCRSPKRTRDVAEWLIAAAGEPGSTPESELLADASEWLATYYHPEWLVARALRYGIGIHHGRLPRAVAHHMVRLFNSGVLKVLLATSTLIEGVNTAAQNVVVLDNTMGAPLKRYDFFTFSNILGRSGRMFRHFVGRVVIYNDAPARQDTEVDIPVLTQPDGTSDSILIQLPWEELSPESRDRMAEIHNQQLLTMETLRANRGVRPELQLEVAQELVSRPDYWTEVLTWRGGQPSTVQVRRVAPLLYTLAGSIRTGGVRTADTLGARLNSLRFHEGELGPLIRAQLAFASNPDEAVEDVLDFLRQWAQFHVPRSLLALERIAKDVLDGAGSIRLSVFAAQLEALFQSPYLTVLEEYGLPMTLTRRLGRALPLWSADNLDEALDRVKRLRIPARLSRFERDIILDVQAGL